MNYKNLATGAVAMVASDFLAPKLPASVDVGGLPLRNAGVALGATYAAQYAMHGKPKLMHTAIVALAALASAELATKVTVKDYTVAGVSLKRAAAGAVGGFAAEHFAK